MNNDKVIAPGMFRINPFKPSRDDKYVPNKVRASVRTNPITVSQPRGITKKDVNSNSNGLSSTGVDNTAKTKRPQPRSNTKNNRVPFASKSSCSKNKEVEVEEHPRNLLLSKNKKHMSSECNNIKFAIRNDKFEVVCAMCKQCLITANHDVCVLNYVNAMNSRGKKQKANVSNTKNQKKQKPKVMKPKKVGSNERLASPKPSKPRSCLRWSPTGRLFDLKGKITASSESDSQSDCSNGDNACTSNPLKPTIKRFPNSTSFLGTLYKFIYDASTRFLGTVRFGNDHVAAILGFGDLQWGNILITKVYFVEGLGHNLFSVRQFCDSDLEVTFRRNTCFVRNLEGVDLLKGNRTTNLYTINLHEMASASPICLMARATSTKSKDEAPEVIKTFLKRITVLLQSPVIIIRTDNGTEFKNQILKEYFDSVGISYQASSVRTPQQNGVENEEIGLAAGTERGEGGKKPDFFLSTCILRGSLLSQEVNDREDISEAWCKAMAFEQRSSGLDLTYAPSTITTQQPTEGELDLLFEAMYDDHIGGQPSYWWSIVSCSKNCSGCSSTSSSSDLNGNYNNSRHRTDTNKFILSSYKFSNTSQDVGELETQQHTLH
ncbi:retrovirus-related pol polyprotein from transposon TNT 1-94 [Tanacetum coccineum]|uniref:Retrovirus-related pol polyprotein from transposon TNT 1-94 n=1 Tax=Tanacetum coccineum TaxID=301880 RepID=A0ABQ5AQA4_9ASTR